MSDYEVRSVILFFAAKNDSKANIHCHLGFVCGPECTSIQIANSPQVAYIVLERENVCAVSYTHLDVYKRQPVISFLVHLLLNLRVYSPRHRSCLLYTSRCV